MMRKLGLLGEKTRFDAKAVGLLYSSVALAHLPRLQHPSLALTSTPPSP